MNGPTMRDHSGAKAIPVAASFGGIVVDCDPHPKLTMREILKPSRGDMARRVYINIDNGAAEAVIQSLRSGFVEQAGNLGMDLSMTLAGMDVQPSSAISQVHRIAHTLAGNAATFGFPVLGQTACKLSEVARRQDSDLETNIRDIRELALRLLSLLQEVSPDCA